MEESVISLGDYLFSSNNRGVIKGIPKKRKVGGSTIETTSEMMVYSLESTRPNEMGK